MKNDIPAAGREVCNNFFQLQSKPGDIVCFFVTLVSRLRRVRRMRLQVVGIIFGSDPSSKSDRDLRTSEVGLSRLCIHLMMAHTREMSPLQRDVYQSFSPVIMRQHAFLLSIVCGLHRETTEKRNLFRCTWKERAVQLRCENRAAMLELECPPCEAPSPSELSGLAQNSLVFFIYPSLWYSTAQVLCHKSIHMPFVKPCPTHF